tara:strand:+ start:231 stop:434 length:204 start_codon:yes stop_codon:yes gene_type:complete
MPRSNEDSVLVSPTKKQRATFYITLETQNRINSLSEMMNVPMSSIIEKSVSVYTDAVIKEKKKYGNS